MKLLYLHAYQSYIWNKIASKRIRQYGLQVLSGDLTKDSKDKSETGMFTVKYFSI